MRRRHGGHYADRVRRRRSPVALLVVTAAVLAACTTIAPATSPPTAPPATQPPSGSTAQPPSASPLTETPVPASAPATAAASGAPSTAPTPTPTPPTHAFLGFTLELVGAVNPNHAYVLYWSRDDANYAVAMCGYPDKPICEARTFPHEVPAVPIGSEVSWYFELEALSDRQFAEGQIASFDQGRTVIARCIYNPDVNNGDPGCSRVQ